MTHPTHHRQWVYTYRALQQKKTHVASTPASLILVKLLQQQSPLVNDPTMTWLELKWQFHSVGAEPKQIAFHNNMLKGFNLQGYTFMSPGFPFFQTYYNISCYAHNHPVTTHLNSKINLFCGDHKEFEEPNSIAFADNDLLKWNTIQSNNGYMTFIIFYTCQNIWDILWDITNLNNTNL